MSIWKKTMDYLGLGPDEAYEDYEDQNEPEPAARARGRREGGGGEGGSSSMRGRQPNRDWPSEPDEPQARQAPARPSFPSRDFESPVRRTGQPALEDSGTVSRPQPRSTATRGSNAPSNAEPQTVRPRRFDQAQEVADKFKEGQSVILNLEATERDVARRLIDFASGVCYSLDGSMEKVATGVYLLKPAPSRATRANGDDDDEG